MIHGSLFVDEIDRNVEIQEEKENDCTELIESCGDCIAVTKTIPHDGAKRVQDAPNDVRVDDHPNRDDEHVLMQQLWNLRLPFRELRKFGPPRWFQDRQDQLGRSSRERG